MSDRATDGQRSREDAPSVDSAGSEYHPPPKADEDPRELRLRQLVGLDRVPGTPYPPNATDPWLVGCRVDALVVAYRLEPSRLNRKVDARLRLAADTAGPVELALGPITMALRSRPQGGFAWFENADVRGTLDWRATGGWHLEIVPRATFLATHSPARAVELCDAIAQSLAPIVEGPRLRRVDLAADFMHFKLDAADRDRLATTRAAITEFSAESKDVDEVRHHGDGAALRMYLSSTHKVTGFAIAAGNCISARIYDKTAELRSPGREEKRAIEHALWELRGWTGEDVTRVEFQLRNVFLDDVNLRDAHELPEKLDGLWQRCVRWLRVIDPASSSRPGRCTLDPRWEAVQAVVFEHQASPIARTRKRGGASARHSLGATLSFAASNGRLRRVDTVDIDGVVLDDREFVGRMTEEQACRRLTRLLHGVYEQAADELAASLVADLGPKRAFLHVVCRNNAAVARFSSIDDDDGGAPP